MSEPIAPQECADRLSEIAGATITSTADEMGVTVRYVVLVDIYGIEQADAGGNGSPVYDDAVVRWLLRTAADLAARHGVELIADLVSASGATRYDRQLLHGALRLGNPPRARRERQRRGIHHDRDDGPDAT